MATVEPDRIAEALERLRRGHETCGCCYDDILPFVRAALALREDYYANSEAFDRAARALGVIE